MATAGVAAAGLVLSATPASAADTLGASANRNQFSFGGGDPAPIAGGGQGWQTWASGEVWRLITQFQTTDPDPDPDPEPGACRVTDTVNAWNGASPRRSRSPTPAPAR
ncbi:hypothetical protein [Actinophytocola gossypii]|uniref:hypothetical protein n=1 Tax=Actinophytocola gossypii TaxID=2812003 RepID=UPI0021A2BB78|nr:hypothetical protein [Actinophytocola gossypii]